MEDSSSVDDVTWIVEGMVWQQAGATRECQPPLGQRQRSTVRDAQERGDTLLKAEEALTMRPGGPGGWPDGQIRSRGQMVVSDLTRFNAYLGREPAPTTRQGRARPRPGFG